MIMWIARELDNRLFLYTEEPCWVNDWYFEYKGSLALKIPRWRWQVSEDIEYENMELNPDRWPNIKPGEKCEASLLVRSTEESKSQ